MNEYGQLTKPTAVLVRRIVLALAYSDQFDFPLHKSEIVRRIITNSHDYDARDHAQSFAQALLFLLDKNLCETQFGYFWLAGKERLLPIRQTRYKISKEKIKEADELKGWLQRLPFVRLTLITGALAVKNTPNYDDSDFLVVCWPNTLWLTRLMVSFFAWRKGRRRSWGAAAPDSWCFNMWLTSNNLSIPHERRTIYTAYELLQAQVLLDKNGLYEKWLTTNSWVNNFLSLWWQESVVLAIRKNQKQLHNSSQLTAYTWQLIVSPINFLAYLLQRIYMLAHQTKELISYQEAFFHPRDTKSQIYRSWLNSVLEWQKNY